MDAQDPIRIALSDPAFTHPAPERFGPALWATIHTIIRAYEPTPNGQLALRAFMAALGDLFPCARCAPHVQAAAKDIPTHSKAAALKWSIDFHNAVNARIGKPVLTYTQAVAAMVAAPASETQWSTLAKVLLPLLVAAVIVCIVMAILLGTSATHKQARL